MNIDISIIRQILDGFRITIENLKPLPGTVNLICDATFFRKRKDKDGLLIFSDSNTGRVLWFKFIESETKSEYLEGLRFLKEKGVKILSVTIDGKTGIKDVFRHLPVQVCQFHVQKTILKKTTLKPQTECGKELKHVSMSFINQRWSKDKFEKEILTLLQKHQKFLKEKNENNQYQHKNLRSAFYTIKLALPNLFIHQEHKNLNIPNTTNHIDGGINPKIKRLVDLHRGMKIERRNVLISNLLVGLGE